MGEFHNFHPIRIRYSDIDAQRHVNNARYFSFMEDARVNFIRQLDLWDGEDFDQVGVIMLEASCTFLAPILIGQSILVGTRVTHLGNKSIILEHSLIDDRTQNEMARGKVVLVAYDYLASRSMPLPDNWRLVLENYR
jgi:acyl-CoA thioester hydrolase